MKYTKQQRLRLAEAASEEIAYLRGEGLGLKEMPHMRRVAFALVSLPLGSDLPLDLTGMGDGRTDAEVVAVALDYYGIS